MMLLFYALLALSVAAIQPSNVPLGLLKLANAREASKDPHHANQVTFLPQPRYEAQYLDVPVRCFAMPFLP
jgi:hypothetical protein